jgi:hypothetical protein
MRAVSSGPVADRGEKARARPVGSRIAAANAGYRILILSRAPRPACRYPVSGEAGRSAMEVIYPRVAGLDVHKKVVWV